MAKMSIVSAFHAPGVEKMRHHHTEAEVGIDLPAEQLGEILARHMHEIMHPGPRTARPSTLRDVTTVVNFSTTES